MLQGAGWKLNPCLICLTSEVKWKSTRCILQSLLRGVSCVLPRSAHVHNTPYCSGQTKLLILMYNGSNLPWMEEYLNRSESRQGKAKRGEARQGKARWKGKAMKSKAKEGKARKGKESRGEEERRREKGKGKREKRGEKESKLSLKKNQAEKPITALRAVSLQPCRNGCSELGPPQITVPISLV